MKEVLVSIWQQSLQSSAAPLFKEPRDKSKKHKNDIKYSQQCHRTEKSCRLYMLRPSVIVDSIRELSSI
jgi:hypothetical protein